MFSQLLKRSMAIHLNPFGCRQTRRVAIRRCLPAECVRQNCLSFGIHSMTTKLDGRSNNSVGKCLIIIAYFMSGRSAAW
jgi:hypothetical protein